MPAPPKTAIIGAGPAGLTLANILTRHHIPFALYEGDASALSRNQGGTLDLHPSGGQLALREAGLWDAFTTHARPESDVLKVVQNDGTVLWDGNSADKVEVSEEERFAHRPEIDRAVLMQLLLEGLEEGSVRWGKKLVKVVPGDADTWDLHFADGAVDGGFGLVVGADGAWSKVRKVLTDEMPHYSGISGVEMWALDVEQKHPWIAEYVGAGSCFSFGEGRTVQSQRIGDGSVRTYACLRKPESWVQECGIDWSKPDTARKELVERYYDDCGEDLKRLILESPDNLVPRPLYMLPVGFRWESKPGVTLIGDAAHLMTPFAGVGVNVAMVDALELGRAIVGFKEAPDGKSLAKFLSNYESELFPRAAKYSQKTLDNLYKHFSATGSEDLAKRLRVAYGRPG